MSTTQCLPAYDVQFVAPASGDFVDGGGGPVMVQVTVAADSGFDAPASVVVSVGLTTCDTYGGPLASVDGGTWSADFWRPAQLVDGQEMVCVTAYWPDGGVVAGPTNVVVNVDVTPPNVSLAVLTPPHLTPDPALADAGAYFRDDPPLPVQLTIDDGSGSWGVQSMFDGGAVSGLVTGADGGLEINLQMLALNGANASYDLGVSAKDAVGNVAPMQVQSFEVTRWKWVADTGTGTSVFMPAAAGGAVYAAAAAGSNNTVFSYDSNDGSLNWPTRLGASATLPPSVAPTLEDRLFVVTGRTINVVDLASGTDAGSDDGGDNSLESMAIAVGGGQPDTATVSAYDGNLFGMPSTGVPYAGGFAFSSSLLSGVVATGASTILDVTGTSPVLQSISKNSGGPFFGSTVHIADLVSDPADSQATAATGPVADDNGYFFYSDTARVIGHVWTDAGIEAPAAASILHGVTSELIIPESANVVASLSNASVARVWIEDGGLLEAATSIDARIGLLSASGHLYAVSGGAQSMLTAIDDIGGLPSDGGLGAIAWQLALNDLASGPPGIACARSGAREALLLIPTGSGHVIALVLDDTGLNQSAPWPKARHDQFNSANTATPLLTCQ